MKTNYKVTLAMLAGLAIGAAGGGAIHAQQIKTPPAYIISEAEAMVDPVAIQKYAEKVPDTFAPFNGHYHFLLRGGKPQSLYGEAPQGIVVIAFDSAEQAHAWYDSPAYKAIRPLREGAVKGRLFLAEGVAPQ